MHSQLRKKNIILIFFEGLIMKKQLLLSVALLLSISAASIKAVEPANKAVFSKEEFIRHIGCQFLTEGATQLAEKASGKDVLYSKKGVNILTVSDVVQASAAAGANYAHSKNPNKEEALKAAGKKGAEVLAREKIITLAALTVKATGLDYPEAIKKHSTVTTFFDRFFYYAAQDLIDKGIRYFLPEQTPQA